MKKYFGVLILLLKICFPVAAQETLVIQDLHLWTGVKIEKSLSKDWTLSFQEEIRFKTNISEINNYFSELELEYRINKHFALDAAFRFTRDKDQVQGYDPLTRYHFDLKYKRKLDFLTFQYRFRYQREVEGLNMFDPNAINEKLFRNRIGLKVNNLAVIEPYTTFELFQEISPYVIPRLIYWRLVAGVEFDAGSLGEFKVGWGLNRSIGQDIPVMVYMLRVNYTYKF